MKNSKLKLTTVAVLSALGISACMHDSDDTTAALAKEDVVTSGVITGFGSVFINGVEYETDNAAFNIDDQAGAENQLEVGMYITLRGSVNADGSTGAASSIEFENDVEGMVLANNISVDGTLDVMGQSVTVTADTRFESDVATILAPADIGINNIVEVSGYSSGTGTVYATRIEVKAETHAGEEMELKGVVSNLTASTFNIGNMVIDHTTAQLEDFGDVALADGMYVEVKSTDGMNQNNALIASKVELEDAEGKSEKRGEGEEVELEGVITMAPNDMGSFEVNGQTAVLADDVEFEGGSLADMLNDTKVDIEGRYDADGNFVITEVEFERGGDHEYEAYVDAVNAEAGTITLFGKQIIVNNYTVTEDERDENGFTPVRYFSLKDIAVGDRVEVEFYVDDTSGELVATELSRDDDEYAGTVTRYVQLEGPVDSFDSNNNPVVSGISVDITAGDPGLTVALGDTLEVKGTFSAGAFTTVEISLGDD